MSYQEAVRYLGSLGRELASPRQAKVQKFDLRNIGVLADALGHPERPIVRSSPCCHIAGTNGKGSTAAMIERILRAAGMKTGLYTSPHLERINERIRINGAPIGDAEFAAAFERVLSAIEAEMAAGVLTAHPTFFEVMTAMAFAAFEQAGVKFAVYEVGLGGRLDATNIVSPRVAVITEIDFDHEAYLGHSLREIAGEKAGIIKVGAVVVSSATSAEARAVIVRRCEEQGARLVEVDWAWRLRGDAKADARGAYRVEAEWVDGGADGEIFELAPALAGKFQVRNALAAAAAAMELAEQGFAIGRKEIQRGVAEAEWPGRLELVARGPDVYLDGAHNPGAARALRDFWEENFRGKRIFLVYGAMRDKQVDEVAGLLFPRAECVIFTQPRQTRAISAEALADISSHWARSFECVADVEGALRRARELAGGGEEGVVFATGSLFLVGEAREILRRGQIRK
jgi:dihydrofolate synthase/folylpolyglutamate synthase